MAGSTNPCQTSNHANAIAPAHPGAPPGWTPRRGNHRNNDGLITEGGRHTPAACSKAWAYPSRAASLQGPPRKQIENGRRLAARYPAGTLTDGYPAVAPIAEPP